MANRSVRMSLCHAVVVVLAASARGAPDTHHAPAPLSAAIAQAWRDAGAEVGWTNDLPPQQATTYEFWRPWRNKVETGAIPAFRFPNNGADGIAKLPNPETGFGLDFHCGYYAGVSLKELATLQNLQSLNIGGVQGEAYADLKDLAGMTNLRSLYLFYLRVTDEQARNLAGLEGLQVLDLSHTPITDVGLKELERLQQLRWLNIQSADVTPAGVAALQKKLPRCKILSDED